jgi:hypothetical protein
MDVDEEGPDYRDPFADLSEKHSDMVIEILLRMLDWMDVNKNTSTSAAGVWEMLASQVPEPMDFPVFSAVKAILVEYMQGRVELIPICVNNCMAFYNCKSEGYSDAYWQTADDDFCKHCGEDRWCRPNVHAPTGMNRKVQLSSLHGESDVITDAVITKIRFNIRFSYQVMYYLPTEHFVHDLFKQPDVSENLENHDGDADPGSIKASWGYAKKVTNTTQCFPEGGISLSSHNPTECRISRTRHAAVEQSAPCAWRLCRRA